MGKHLKVNVDNSSITPTPYYAGGFQKKPVDLSRNKSNANLGMPSSSP